MPGPNNQLLARSVGARRRVVRARVPFSAYEEIVVSFRRFRTAKHRRSRRFSQSVFRTPIFSFNETAIALKRRPRREYQVFLRPKFKLTARSGLATALMLAGISSTFYFATHLQTAPRLYVSSKSASTSGTHAVTGNIHPVLAGQLKRQAKLNLVKKPAVAKARPKPPVLSPAMARSEPLRIRIPKIQIDTSLLPIGLGQTGAIAMPEVFDQVGWYDKSPTPGERGPAVIVGHVDSPQGIAIFWNLRQLLPGDIVQVVRRDNTVATFKVTNIEQFPKDQFPTRAVYGNLSYAGIRLITCGGTFNTLTGQYSLDTVVFGSLLTV